MARKKTGKNSPKAIDDKDLDQASGGLLVPAVQAAREAARGSSSSANTCTGVTTINEGTLNATDDP